MLQMYYLSTSRGIWCLLLRTVVPRNI